jgi:ribose transport system substrate-binding protein
MIGSVAGDLGRFRTLISAALVVGLGVGATHAEDTSRDTSRSRIAMTDFVISNSWHKQMNNAFEAAAEAAKKAKLLADLKVLNSSGSAPAQASQISNFILQKWDAIAVDAASTTALNGVIEDACKAKIIVVTFDSLATASCAYKIGYDWKEYGRIQVEFFAKKFGGKGNILEVMGLPGTDVADDTHKGVLEAIAKYPDLKLVSSVRGDFARSVAQKAVASVLPSLPKIDGVITIGENALGVYQAFKDAGREIPLIVMANKHEELALWRTLNKNGEYDTMSINTSPSIATVAFWVTMEALAGKDIPKKPMYLPFNIITNENLEDWIKVTPEESIAMVPYDRKWTQSLLVATLKGDPSPANPPPPPE